MEKQKMIPGPGKFNAKLVNMMVGNLVMSQMHDESLTYM